MWFHRCDQCRRRRLVGWYYEVYPPIGSEGDESGWWWACADCLVNIVSDRLESIPCEAENERLTRALVDWKMEIANCTNCHYHRHIARGLTPHVLANGRAAIQACKECHENDWEGG
jgi:hypothetical protein